MKIKSSLLIISLASILSCKISDKPKQLTGRILEFDNMKPLANAKVTLFAVHYTSKFSTYTIPLSTTTTDANGRYKMEFDWDKGQDYCLSATAEGCFGEFGENTKTELKGKTPAYDIVLRPHAYLRLRMIGNKGALKALLSLPEAGQQEAMRGTDTTRVLLMEGVVTKKYAFSTFDNSGNVKETKLIELRIDAHDTMDLTLEF